MQWVLTLVVVLQLLTALVMIGLVLVQHGKGADMGASFGSGASGSLFGASGSANFLSRSTAVCAAIFFACTLALAYFGNLRTPADESSGGSILERAAPGAASAPAAASAPIAASAPTSAAASATGEASAAVGAAALASAPSAASAASAAASGSAQIPN